MSHVFLSYNHKDQNYAEKLHQALEQRNYEVWRDVNLLPGDAWMDGITKAIIDCRVFVVIMSPSSSVSRWVKKERLIAERFNKPTIPLLLAGDPFIDLTDIQYERVVGGKLPSKKFYAKLDQFFNIPVPSLSPQEEIRQLKEQIAKLQSLVDDTSKPTSLQLNDGVSDEVREKMRQRLIELAKEGKTIEYKQLGLEFGFRASHDPRFTIPGIVGNISIAENQAGRPLLSVLVVNHETGRPGDGFYTLARYLKPEYEGAGDLKILSDEMKTTFAYWRRLGEERE